LYELIIILLYINRVVALPCKILTPEKGRPAKTAIELSLVKLQSTVAIGVEVVINYSIIQYYRLVVDFGSENN